MGLTSPTAGTTMQRTSSALATPTAGFSSRAASESPSPLAVAAPRASRGGGGGGMFGLRGCLAVGSLALVSVYLAALSLTSPQVGAAEFVDTRGLEPLGDVELMQQGSEGSSSGGGGGGGGGGGFDAALAGLGSAMHRFYEVGQSALERGQAGLQGIAEWVERSPDASDAEDGDEGNSKR